MDILSHGLWGSVAFGRKSRRSFWTAFFFGVFPDFTSFGLFFVSTWLGFEAHPDFSHDLPSPDAMPGYVHILYNITHSFAIFAAAFLLVWLVRNGFDPTHRKKPFWEMGAWGLHILVDIPTHSYRFFPTPFLWPFSGIKFDGTPWGDPIIFIPNAVLLVATYAWYYASERKKERR